MANTCTQATIESWDTIQLWIIFKNVVEKMMTPYFSLSLTEAGLPLDHDFVMTKNLTIWAFGL